MNCWIYFFGAFFYFLNLQVIRGFVGFQEQFHQHIKRIGRSLSVPTVLVIKLVA